MKHYHFIVLFIFTGLIFQSCQYEKSLNPTKTIITGVIINLDQYENKNWLEFVHPDLFALEAPIDLIEIDSLGHFTYEMDLVSPALCWVIYNKWFPVVISPGDSLFLTINANIWNDSTSSLSTNGKYIEISGTVKADYSKIIKFEEWASDSIYTGSYSLLKNKATKEKKPNEYKEFIKSYETEALNKIKQFGQDNDAGRLFSEILFSEIKYRTMEDLIRYMWLHPLENGRKMGDIVLPEDYFTFLNEYDMENKDFYVCTRLDFIRELQFFLQFQNSDGRKSFIDIFQNKEIDRIDNDYFNNQADYIYNHTKGITRDLCLYFFAFYNLEKVQGKSSEIYASVANLIKDTYVKKKFHDEFHSMVLRTIPKNVPIDPDQMTSFDSIVSTNQGKIIYVDFWAPWCGPCMDEMGPSKQLREKLKGKNVVFIYLANNCSTKSWEAAIANKDIEGINLLLTKNDYTILRKRYGISGIPHFLLIDKNGKTINNALRPSDKNIESEILNLQ